MPIDMSLAKTPPKKRTPGTTATRAKATPVEEMPSHNERRVQGLNGLAQLGQGICLMFGLHADAAAIGVHFPPISKELSNCADSNESIAKPIDALIEVGPYGALIAAVLPFGLQIAANHGWIDASRLMGQGVVPPAVLEAKMAADMSRMQADAMRQQQQAIQEAQRAQKEYEAVLSESKEG